LYDVNEKQARKPPWKGLEGLPPGSDEIFLVEASEIDSNHHQ